MKKRKLGNSGIEASPLALGGNVFGWTTDEPTSYKILDAFVAAGFDLIDTADTYSRWVPGNKGESLKPSSASGSNGAGTGKRSSSLQKSEVKWGRTGRDSQNPIFCGR